MIPRLRHVFRKIICILQSYPLFMALTALFFSLFFVVLMDDIQLLNLTCINRRGYYSAFLGLQYSTGWVLLRAASRERLLAAI